MVNTSQEISHRTKNFMKLAGEYMVEEILLRCSIATRPHYIEHFDRQYNKAFTK